LYMLFGLVRFLESAGFPLTIIHVGAVSSFITTTLLYWGGWQGQQVAHSGGRVCGSVCCSTPRGCRGSTPLLLLVRVLVTSWDKGCMAASASGNSAAGLRNQIRLVGVYGQLVGLRLPL
jgi:hypothetical protein